MKLASFQVASPIGPLDRLGSVQGDGTILDLSAATRAQLVERGLSRTAASSISAALVPTDVTDFIAASPVALDAAREAEQWCLQDGRIDDGEGSRLVYRQEDVILRASVPHPPLIRDFLAFEGHLANIYPRLGREIPAEWYEFPAYYKGNPSSVGAHGDEIRLPGWATSLDFELEIAAVIGPGGIDIDVSEASAHIFGYTIYNDFSERVIQRSEFAIGLGPSKAKDFERAHVLGPWLVTADEVVDRSSMVIEASVNGESWCRASLGEMFWSFEQMIARASADERIFPGEVFGSGTAPGGSGAEVGRSLARGDLVELRADGLGVLANRVV